LRWVAVGFASALVALSALVAASREDVVYNKYGVKVTLQQSKEGAEDLHIVLKKGGRPLQHAVFIYAPGGYTSTTAPTGGLCRWADSQPRDRD
jgi:hypothetical protein